MSALVAGYVGILFMFAWSAADVLIRAYKER